MTSIKQTAFSKAFQEKKRKESQLPQHKHILNSQQESSSHLQVELELCGRSYITTTMEMA